VSGRVPDDWWVLDKHVFKVEKTRCLGWLTSLFVREHVGWIFVGCKNTKPIGISQDNCIVFFLGIKIA
jgi:hypothetical protein